MGTLGTLSLACETIHSNSKEGVCSPVRYYGLLTTINQHIQENQVNPTRTGLSGKEPAVVDYHPDRTNWTRKDFAHR